MDGSHNGNLFTFALGAGEELSKLNFYGASDAAVQNGNRLIFTEGDYRAKDPVQAFHAAHGASREAVGNSVLIEGGNFLPPAAGTNRLIEFTAAEGTGDMSDNRIDVSGGDFGAQSKFTAANNTTEAEDARGDAFALTDNAVSITGGTFRTDADVEVAYSETGTLARNRLMIRGLANGRFNMAYAANTESGNASENAIVIEKASNLYVQVDLFAASAGSAAPSTLADNLLFIADSSIDSSSLGAAMNPSGDVVGNRVDIRNSMLRISSGGNIFVYGGLHQGYGGLDGKIAGNYIRLEDVTLDLKDRQAAFFIAGQISASEGGVLTNNTVELAGDGSWDERLAQARLVGAGRFGGTGGDDVRENALRLSGWRGVVSSVKGFNTIELSNIPWEAESTVLRVDMRPYDDWEEIVTEETLDLSGTTFAFVDGGFVFEGGADAHLGESMTLLEAGEHSELLLNPLYEDEGQAVTLTTGITTEVEGRIRNAEDAKSIVLELEDAPAPQPAARTRFEPAQRRGHLPRASGGNRGGHAHRTFERPALGTPNLRGDVGSGREIRIRREPHGAGNELSRRRRHERCDRIGSRPHQFLCGNRARRIRRLDAAFRRHAPGGRHDELLRRRHVRKASLSQRLLHGRVASRRAL